MSLAQAATAAAEKARREAEARVVELTGQLKAAQAAQQTPVVASGSPASTGPPLKVPKPDCFSGSREALPNWTFCMNLYLSTQFGADDLRALNTAVCFLKGAALTWYRYRHTQMPALTSWAELRAALEQAFRLVHSELTAMTRLDNLQQKSTVLAYNEAFMAIMVELPFMDEQTRVHRYHQGLKQRVREQVMVQGHKALPDAMAAAELVASAQYQANSHGVLQTQQRAQAPADQAVPMDLGVARTSPGTWPGGRPPIQCWKCGKFGHVQSRCPQAKKGNPNA
jgi:hypothetical protein